MADHRPKPPASFWRVSSVPMKSASALALLTGLPSNAGCRACANAGAASQLATINRGMAALMICSVQ